MAVVNLAKYLSYKGGGCWVIKSVNVCPDCFGKPKAMKKYANVKKRR